jgi:signal transduction histidine kinase
MPDPFSDPTFNQDSVSISQSSIELSHLSQVSALSSTQQDKEQTLAELLILAKETTKNSEIDPSKSPWKVIVVDDDRYIHQATKLSLSRFTFEQRTLSLMSAYSAAEAKHLISHHPDTAIILLDVVMETSVAGLEVARFIRKDLQNQLVRIILRTGQPTEAPEDSVILNYDINYYTTKTELNQQKLNSLMITALRSYRELMLLHQNQRQFTTTENRHNTSNNLEQLVEQLTAELAEKNQKLEKEISDRLLVEIELHDTKTSADRAQRAKSDFLANMSHELRTPLNAILGFSQLIHSDPSISSEHRDSLKIISSNGKHLLNLINDILDMSQIESGQQLTFNQTNFHLLALLKEIKQILEPRAEAKQINLYLEASPNLPSHIFSDENKLRQTLLNLLGNAIKYTSEGTITMRVFLEPKPNATELHFEIEDTGYGIAPEEFDQLFQLFSQTESGRKSRQGTGLGLSISRHFVEIMGGEIHAQSTLGQGSIFAFFIPLLEIALDSNPDLPTSTGTISYGDMRLLVAHPPEQSLFLPYLISILGIQIRSCFTTTDMLKISQEWNPHLILLDLDLPYLEMAITKIRNSNQTPTKLLAIISQTAEVADLSKEFDGSLVKPIQEKLLAKKIEQLLFD